MWRALECRQNALNFGVYRLQLVTKRPKASSLVELLKGVSSIRFYWNPYKDRPVHKLQAGKAILIEFVTSNGKHFSHLQITKQFHR